MFYEIGHHRPLLPRDPFKACVVPRPIGWITTIDQAGSVNLAPFSFFNAISSDPPMVMYCAGGAHVEGGVKDSVWNVQSVGEFVANLATWELREQVNLSSAAVGRAVDEFGLTGLTPAPSRLVRPPRVAESPIHLECVLHQIIELPSTVPEPSHMVIGRVVGVHISDTVLTDGLVDIRKLEPIARLGYMEYAVIRDCFVMERPVVRREAVPA